VEPCRAKAFCNLMPARVDLVWEGGVGRRERWRPGVLYGIDGEGGEEWRGRKWMPQGVSPKCLRGGKYRERSALSCTIWRLSREFSDLQKLVCFHVICSRSIIVYI
jgi:hypothetical protein